MRKAEQYRQRNASRALPLRVGDAALLADSSGAVFWPAGDTLLVADLHLEKGRAYAGRGVLLPPYDTRESLDRLALVIAHYAPTRVIVLGDSFHTIAAAEELDAGNLAVLAALQRGREWIWLAGNHDPTVPRAVGGAVIGCLTLGGITLRHSPTVDDEACEIAGHLHPAARLSVGGDVVRRRCFIANARRLVLPAFGALAGGLNVRDEAFAPYFGTRLEAGKVSVCMLGSTRVFSVPPRSLLPD